MNKHFYALLFGMALSSGGHDAWAQVVRGSNGSQSPLAPLTLNKKSARRLSSPHIKFRADFVPSNQQYFVLGFDKFLSAQTEEIVTRHAQILTYVSDHMYILTTSHAPEKAIAAIKQELQGLATITAEGTLPANYKLTPRLYDCVKEARELPEEITREGVVVATFTPEDREALEKTLDKWKVNYELTNYQQVRLVEATTQLVAQVAALPYVSYLNIYEEPKELAFSTSHIMQTNRVFSLNYDRKGPTGEGVTFANWETFGAEYEHDINTYGRNVERGPKGEKLTDNTTNSHGTHCGLIVSGADNIEENMNRGMAPGVQIIAMNNSVSPWGMHHNGVRKALDLGFKPLVSNHSVGWNVANPNTYNDAASTVDDLIYKSNTYMCCYSTGNSAEGKAKYDKYQDYDYGRITGDIKTNKNGFAVHSVIYPGVDVTWANFGPTFDGRMKPELCAEGSGGTSYASPGMAGATSLLLEQCKNSLGSHRIDVVKAVMLNTALDVRTYDNLGEEAGFGIDYRTGYGEVHPIAAARSLEEKRVDYEQKVSNGETIDYPITVPEGQVELNVTLYWNDPAAPAGTSKALVNDLDLEVIAPDGETVLPWTLDPTPANVTKPAKRAVNDRDNHERVRITAAKAGDTIKPGTYKIRVKGTKVTTSSQRFVTTWQWKKRGIEWTSIPEGFRVAAGDRLLLTWDMTVTDEEDRQAPNFAPGKMTPKVYYRTTPLEQGQDDPTKPESGWQRCEPVEGTRYWYNDMKGGQRLEYGTLYGKNFLQWIVPEGLENTSQLQFMVVAGKLEEGGISAISPKAHVGEQPTTRPTILSLNESKVKLEWEPAKTVKKGMYQIYALYDKYMTKVGEVPIGRTTAEIAAPEGVKWNQNQFFAVGIYDEEAKVQGKRSLPVGLDPYNYEAVDKEEVWQENYILCPGEVVPFSTNRLEGDIQWYKNNKVLEGDRGKLRVLPLTMEDTGRYHYTVTLDGKLVFSSPKFNIKSRGIKRSDTEVWGDYAWSGLVYGKSSGNNLPEITDEMPFHGKFALNKFTFNSHKDLFDWAKDSPSNIPGYVGCESGKNDRALIVMKRRGFREGTYVLKFHRASGIAKAIITDANGKRTEKTTPVNSHTTYIGNFKLDANSTIELHWTGVHCAFEAIYNSSAAERTVRPAQVAVPSPSFWLDPTVLPGAHGEQVKRIIDGYPQAETYNLTSRTGALLNKSGSNYNAALRFNGNCSYVGGMRTPNTGKSAVDFLVLSSTRNLGSDRVLSYGTGEREDGNMASYTLYINNSNQLATMRNYQKTEQTGSNTARTMLYTVARNEKDVTIAANGEKITGRSQGYPDALDLQQLSIGGSFVTATPNYFRGTLAEAVHYDAEVKPEDQNSIRTYLAIKHGITLDHDYVENGTKVLFPVSATSTYRYQITGIGRQDYSRLNQKQSRGQLLNGNASLLILSLGDLANSNEENSSKFAYNGSYYILAANSNYAPNLAEGNVSRVSYQLRSTTPNNQKADMLSFIVPKASFTKENKRAYIEFSNKELNAKTIGEGQSELVELKNYTADGVQYLRAQYAPKAHDTYFRIVWKDGGVTGIHSAEAAAEGVSYEAATRTVSVNVAGVEQLDLTDLSGRTLATGISVVGGKARLPELAPAPYMLTLRNATSTLATVKLNVVK